MSILAGNTFNVRDFAPALWLDAADSSTLFDATVGGNLVAAGGAVARWEDKSGNGRHATQANAAQRPLRTVGAQNTRDSLRFDGTNDTMTCPVLPTSATDFSVVIVGSHAAKTWTGNFNTELQVYMEMPHSSTRGWVFQTRPDQGTNRFQFAALPTSSGTGIIRDVLPNQYNVLVGTRIQNGADSFSVNGVNQINANTTAWVFQNSPLTIASFGGGTRFLQGDILEIMIFSYVLSTEQRQAIERYLASKWGLGFNPLSLSPALWLDASDSSTLYDATTGGNLVAAGGTVARWEDKSGNARHATQSTLANRPIRTVAAQGGRDVLTFDGARVISTASLASPTSQTLFAVARASAWNTFTYRYIYGHGTLGLNSSIGVVITSATEFGWRANNLLIFGSGYNTSQTPISIGPVAPGSDYRIVSSYLGASSATGLLNGVRFSTITENTGNISSVTDPIRIGANGSGTQTWLGDIAEIIVYNSILSNAQRQAVERYLAQKWNIIT